MTHFDKAPKSTTLRMVRLQPIALAVTCLLASLWSAHGQAQNLSANALPTQGQVVQGQIGIQTTGNQMLVQQSSGTGIINWGTYNIGANAGVRYVQPDATASTLNRVLNGSSQIAGQLQANGKVFLLNPNGVLFSPTAQVDVGGLVAAAGTTTDAEYLNGNMKLQLTSGGQVSNQGHITAAQGGQIVLTAARVDNAGTLSAPAGQVSLLGGEAARVNVTADGLIQTQLESRAVGSSVANTGLIEATGLREQGGVIQLVADQVSTSGSINVSSVQAQGGTVNLLASDKLDIGGSIQANGTSGGRIDGTADQTVRVTQAKLEAQGTQASGGVIRMGGDFQGGAWRDTGASKATQLFASLLANTPRLKNTQGLLVDGQSVLNASGAQQGGVVVLWSDQFTAAQGTLMAQGQGGQAQGGAIEVSSHGQLYRPAVNLFDPGKGGVLLLDPRDLYVVSAYTSPSPYPYSTYAHDTGSSTPTNNWFGFGSQSIGTGAADSEVLASTINTRLSAGHSVILTTVRDLYVNATINAASSSSDRTQLQLEAGRSIFLNKPIYLRGSNLGLKIVANHSANGGITSEMRGGGASQIIQAEGATLYSDGSIYIFQDQNSFSSLADSMTLSDIYSAKTLLIEGAGSINLMGNYVSSNPADTTAAWIAGNNLFIHAPKINVGGDRKTVLYATGSSFDKSDLALSSLLPFQPPTSRENHFSNGVFPDGMVLLLAATGSTSDSKINFTNYMITSSSWSASTPTEVALKGTSVFITPAANASDVPGNLWKTSKSVSLSDLVAGNFNFSDVTENMLATSFISAGPGVVANPGAPVVAPDAPTVEASTSSSVISTAVTVATSTNNSLKAAVFVPTSPIQTSSSTVQVQTGETSSWRPVLFEGANQQITRNPEVARLKECDEADGGGQCIAKARTKTVASVADGHDGLPVQPISKRRALVIGNASYFSPLGSLGGVSKDAHGVTALLKQQGYEVTRVDNAGRADMVNALNELIRTSEADDSVMVYYAGHGHIHAQTGNGYWLPSDASISDASTWLSNTDIVRFLKNIPAKQLLLVSDSCFSGALTRETVAEKTSDLQREGILKRRSVVVMSSGGEEPVADQGKDGYSPFAGELIQKLGAVTPQDEERAINVLTHVRENLKGAFKQTPFYGALPSAGHVNGGEYLFGRNGVE